MARLKLGLGDKERLTSQFFGEGALASDPSQRTRTTLTAATNQLIPKLIPNVTHETLEDGSRRLTARFDAADELHARNLVRAELERLGFPPLSAPEFEAYFNSVAERRLEEKPQVNFEKKIDTVEFQRGVLKILFELGWLWLGEDFLRDPAAIAMRTMILEGMPPSTDPARVRVEGDIQIGVVDNIFTLWNDQPDLHVGFIMTAPGIGHRIILGVRLFSAFSGWVFLSETADRYPVLSRNEFDGQCVTIDPKTGAMERISYPQAVANYCRAAAEGQRPG